MFLPITRAVFVGLRSFSNPYAGDTQSRNLYQKQNLCRKLAWNHWRKFVSCTTKNWPANHVARFVSRAGVFCPGIQLCSVASSSPYIRLG